MIVYTITNKVNGKKYVGQTSKTLARRWNNHKAAARRGASTAIANALRKHGEECFQTEIVFESDNIQEIYRQEQESIKLLNTRAPNGYNLSDGGESGAFGMKFSQESRERLSQAMMGHEVSEETRQKISRGHIGIKLTPEIVENIRRQNLGRTPWNKGLKGVMVAWNKGKPFSPESREKMRLSAIARYARQAAARAEQL